MEGNGRAEMAMENGTLRLMRRQISVLLDGEGTKRNATSNMSVIK
jgi:hypothetical protein